MTPSIDVGSLAPYGEVGLDIIPLHRYDAVDGKGRQRGKSPRDGAWQRREYRREEVLDWAREGNNAGVRLTAGWMVLDVDPRNFPEGEDSLLNLRLEVGLDLRACPATRTGSGGFHYWFRKPEGADLVDSLPDYPGVEFKSRGRQVVAAGCVHPSGGRYAWMEGPPLQDAPPVPESLLRLAGRPTRAAGQDASGLGEMTPEALAETLATLRAEDFREHDEWLQLMMACHHATAGEGRQEFVDWSTSDPNYADRAWDVGRRWDSLHAQAARGGRPVTARYLWKVAQAHGGRVAQNPPEADFAPATPEERREAESAAASSDPVDEMNARHAAVFEGGKFRVFTEQVDPVLQRAFYARSTRDDLLNLYSNTRVEVPSGDGTKVVSKAAYWLMHPRRRQYQGVVFDPEREHEGWLNLWKGWAVEPRKGDWSLLQQLIRETLCDGDEAGARYVLDWLAHMAQHPGRAAEVALVFRGEKGTGKGTLGRAAAALAGGHGLHISSPEHLVGRFNSHLQNCLLLFADEAFWAGDKAGESKLKQLVTEPVIAYEGKGRDAVSGKNLIHIIMASNGAWVVPAGLDGERRFAVFEVSTNRKGDRAFFEALNRQMYREGGLAAMLHDLLVRPIGQWEPRDAVPSTEGLLQQKLMSMDDVESWWFQKLTDGHLPGMQGDWAEGGVRVVKATLRRDYLEHAREQRVFKPANEVSFGIRLRRIAPLENVLVRPGDGDLGCATDSSGRSSGYEVLGLERCRAMLEERVGEIKWKARKAGD